MVVNNHNYPVYYDYSHGGYGYWNGPLWVAYDVMRDSLMLDALMNHQGYSYGGYNNYYPGYQPRGGITFGGFSIIFLIICAVVVVKLIRL